MKKMFIKMFIMLVLGITLLNTRIYIEDYDISHFKENEICVSIFNKDIFLSYQYGIQIY